jgi:hypothetical protein
MPSKYLIIMSLLWGSSIANEYKRIVFFLFLNMLKWALYINWLRDDKEFLRKRLTNTFHKL